MIRVIRKSASSSRAVVFTALMLWPAAARAQHVSVTSLKAAFLTNFAKFAVWPDDAVPAGRTFTFCVAGDQAVGAALEQNIKDHPGPVPVSFMFVGLDGPLHLCQLLYLGGLDLREARRVIGSLQGAPIFTVSDVDGFTESGGVAQLRLENGRMRFSINAEAAHRAHLALSAKFLSLATLVKDGSDAVR
jgi:hypothetical protein